MNIIGDGNIPKGDYKNIKVVGNVTAIGDINVNDLKVVGELDSEFNIKARTLKIVGDITAKVIEADKFNLVGRVESDKIIFKEANLTGDVHTKIIEGNRVQSKKSIFEVEKIDADLVDLQDVTGKVDVINGETIKIYKKKNKMLLKSNELYVNEIEADNIYLEKVKVNKVSGNKVIIGPDCDINYLYSKSYDIHKKSNVKEVI